VSSQMQPFTLRPGAGAIVRNLLGGPISFKLRGEQSDGAMTVLETEAPPGEGPPLHVHDGQDEWLYVLGGDMRFRLADHVVSAPAGSFAFIPRGVPHCWQNVGSTPSLMLAVIAPSGLERFFERYAELPEADRSPESFRALGQEAGMTVIGPPLAHSHPMPEQRASDTGQPKPRGYLAVAPKPLP
jgi:quercetin dioxygenase-like cupin family protein